ncbi:MAG: tetratricopeptide repeat protein [Patescibacteria group bacterium]|nr:tetratricopeptide repeat protein [Patescibacteria group bacterium]
MNKDIKLTIAFTSTIIILILLYFGAFLPFKKSRLYIEAVRSSSQVRSVQEFNKLFDGVIGFYSPVGQGEVVYAYVNLLVNVVQNQQERTVAEILLKQADKAMEPMIKADKGPSYFQALYSYGLLYELAANKFKDAGYFQKAAAIYEIAYKHSPGRPTLLSGLYRVYSALGDTGKARKIAEIMLKYWPEDDKIKEIINSL